MSHVKGLMVVALLCANCATVIAATQVPNSSPPVGNYLWFPGKGGPKSDADCKSLVAELKPTDEQVQQWYWGRAPNSNFESMPFFLIVTPDRIETTFSAEGDFDYGDVKFGETINGDTAFTLVPDDHPDTIINGRITAKVESQMIILTLFGIPAEEESMDRVSYFCRFDPIGVTI